MSLKSLKDCAGPQKQGSRRSAGRAGCGSRLVNYNTSGDPGARRGAPKSLKALYRPTETRIVPLRGKGGMFSSIGKLQHKCKPGGPALSAEVLESVVQAHRNKNHAGRAECGARVDNYNTSEDPGARRSPPKPLKVLYRPTKTRITPLRGKGGMWSSSG